MNKIDFQAKAQAELVNRAVTLLERAARSTITLKAPTGSGKTVMMANALAGISRACEGKHQLAILWVAPNKLHTQSHSRLSQVYAKSRALDCVTADELTGPDLPERAVVFMNWASIDSDELVLRRDNETGRNLQTFIERARFAGRKVVLVVDESHLHLDSGDQAQVVVDRIIQPHLIIEVSATPRTVNADAPVVVLREDVVASGMIRKSITVNPGSGLVEQGGVLRPTYDGTSESLLDAALEHQAELTRKLKQAGSPVVPLILVQLPDRRTNPEALAHFERYLLMKHGLERGNGVAVWLSGDRSPEIDEIADFSSSVRVMFFKQAAATGWDCPRAQVLVGLREMQSKTFSTQVLGRIIRQPEHKHYSDDELNHGYVFTNYPTLEMDAEAASWLSKVFVRAREPFLLPFQNWYAKNQDNRSHLTLDSVKYMLAHKAALRDVKHQGEVHTSMVENQEIVDIDSRRSIEGTRDVVLGVQGLQQQLDSLKGQLVSSTASQTKGKKYIEKALRDAAIAITGSDDEKTVLETILHPANQYLFVEMATRGINDFLDAQDKASRVLVQRDEWSAPDSRFLELTNPLEGYGKCLYAPVLSGQFQKSDVEEPFSRLIDSSSQVSVWLKNGDNGQEHFAIAYELEDVARLFYPDFILRTVDGGLRLFDTKGAGDSEHSTGNAKDTHAKARALAAFIKERKAEGHNIEGGIVIRKRGHWLVHSGVDYPGTLDVSEACGWRALDI